MTIITEKMVAGGNCIARYKGKIVFIPYSLPNEHLKIQFSEEKKDYSRAEIKSILEPSPFRVIPFCPLFGQCGGCNLQMIAYPYQQKLKKNIIRESLERAGLKHIPTIDFFVGPETAYRSRFQFHRDINGSIGLKKEKSSQTIAIENCPIAVPIIQKALKDKILHEKILHTNIKNRFNVFGTEDSLFIEQIHRLAQVEILNKTLNFNVNGFFQSNLFVLKQLINSIVQFLPTKNKNRLLDFYAGIGTFSMFANPYFKETVLVEYDEHALNNAKKNLDKIPHRRCLTSDAYWHTQNEAKLAYDCAIIDPPRQGIHKNALSWFVSSKIPLILYVSCNPATFARDAVSLIAGGYSFSSLFFYDFYPHTHHIETLGVFVK